MKRALAIAAVALLVLVAGGAAADSFTLTVVSQTSSTITFSYPQQTGYGYLYSANGTVVSRTNDPTVTTVKFSKNTANDYEVATIVKGPTGRCCAPPPVTTINIGETAVLPSDDNGNGNLLVAQSAILSQTATLQSLSFYVTSAAGNLRLGVYASASAGGPGQKVAETASFAAVSGWNTQPVANPVSLAAGTYWLAYLPSSNSLGFRKTENASSVGRYYSFTFGPLPASFSTGASSTLSHWSFYATLTTSGSPPPPPAAQCADSADNDGDGKIDYPSDPGCTSTTDNDETDPAPPPPSGGFPDASNTGVPSGTTLTAYTGPSDITVANTVIDSKTTGCLSIRATGVIIRNSRVVCSSGFNVLQVFSGSLLVEDSEVSCGNSNNNGFTGLNITVRRSEISGCENGFNVPGSLTLEDSWIHGLVTANGAHTDGLQFNQGASNITVRHNTIDQQTGITGATSCIIMWDEVDPQNANVLIDGNRLLGGGAAFTIYTPRQGPLTNVRVTNNRLTQGIFGYNGGNGSLLTDGSGNVDDTTGAPLNL